MAISRNLAIRGLKVSPENGLRVISEPESCINKLHELYLENRHRSHCEADNFIIKKNAMHPSKFVCNVHYFKLWKNEEKKEHKTSQSTSSIWITFKMEIFCVGLWINIWSMDLFMALMKKRQPKLASFHWQLKKQIKYAKQLL